MGDLGKGAGKPVGQVFYGVLGDINFRFPVNLHALTWDPQLAPLQDPISSVTGSLKR